MKPKQPSDPARPTHRASPSPIAWWAVEMTREEFSERAAKEFQRMNALSTNQHVTRKQGER
jgi:hypothetical protein